MRKPKDYDNVQPFGEYEPLELGGHILRIVKVEETVSRNGKDMVVIYLDTDKSDRQPLYFKQRYDDDTRENKKWGCTVYQLVEDSRTGGTNPGLVTFHTAVEKSNDGFKVVWGDKYCECFKNMLIGGVFGREQYINQNGKAVFATKCFWFRSVETIKRGVDVPEDRLLPLDRFPANAAVSSAYSDFEEVGSDDDYPF